MEIVAFTPQEAARAAMTMLRWPGFEWTEEHWAIACSDQQRATGRILPTWPEMNELIECAESDRLAAIDV